MDAKELKVLLLAIDDKPDNLTTLRAVVSDRLPGTKVLTALDGLKGIALARAEDPDVILLDIVMPGMDGFEVCRQLKADERLSSIPVLFLTALRTDQDSRIKALEVGGDGFLSKPLNELELIAQIRAMAKVKAANSMRQQEKERLATLVAERTRALERELDERKRIDEALRETQAVLAQAEEMGKVGGWEFDIDTKQQTWTKVVYDIHELDITSHPTVERGINFYTPKSRPIIEQAVRRTIEQGEPFDLELEIITAKGNLRSVHTIGKADPARRKIHGFFQDITDRKHREQTELESRRALLGILEDQARDQAALRTSEERFKTIFLQAPFGVAVIDSLAGHIYEVNPRFAEIAGRSMTEMADIDWLRITHPDDVQADLENMALLNVGKINGFQMEKRYLHPDGTVVWINMTIAPLKVEDKAHPRHLCMIQDITEKRRAEEDVQRYVEQLKSALMSTVEVATTLSAMRDPYTAGHERRVARLAVAIGAELGFDARRQEGLRVAGHLHDIGKINIPAEILTKPGKLSPIQFQLIQGHAQAGYDVLKGVEFPWPVAQVTLQHHERMDGSGYPQGLKGDAILLEARIIAVADVVEAMSSHRPYRPGLGIDKALAEIERGRGTLYDPVVADACLKLFREKGYAIPA